LFLIKKAISVPTVSPDAPTSFNYTIYQGGDSLTGPFATNINATGVPIVIYVVQANTGAKSNVSVSLGDGQSLVLTLNAGLGKYFSYTYKAPGSFRIELTCLSCVAYNVINNNISAYASEPTVYQCKIFIFLDTVLLILFFFTRKNVKFCRFA
jgi:hypothetical protein